MRTNVKMQLKTSLLHFGDERMGTMQIARTMKFKVGEEFIDIPVYTGNAFRGTLRRIAMKDFLDHIGITEEGISAKLYYLLFTGGALTSGSRYEEIGKRREMRRLCPPLSLFGSAIGDQIPAGKLKMPIFIPICKETVDYTEIESNLSFYDMLEDNFYTRRDDLKSLDFNLTDEEKFKNPVQMKYDQQCLVAGTELTGNVVIENDSEIERDCLKAILDRFTEMPYIGGKSAAGHGEVKITYEFNGNADSYYKYLEENKEEIRSWLRNLEGVL